MINIYLHAYSNMVYISCASVDVLSRSCRCEIQQNFTILKKRHMNCVLLYTTIYKVSKTILSSPHLAFTFTKYTIRQEIKISLSNFSNIQTPFWEHKTTISILIKCVYVAKTFTTQTALGWERVCHSIVLPFWSNYKTNNECVSDDILYMAT